MNAPEGGTEALWNSKKQWRRKGFYGIVAAMRSMEGESSPYRISDAIHIGTSVSTGPVKGAGLEGENPDVKAAAITAPGSLFSDFVYIDELSALAARKKSQAGRTVHSLQKRA